MDAYSPEEQAMGWYYSLEDRLGFPFLAKCVAERAISPLRVGDELEVTGMAQEDDLKADPADLLAATSMCTCTSPAGAPAG